MNDTLYPAICDKMSYKKHLTLTLLTARKIQSSWVVKVLKTVLKILYPQLPWLLTFDKIIRECYTYIRLPHHIRLKSFESFFRCWKNWPHIPTSHHLLEKQQEYTMHFYMVMDVLMRQSSCNSDYPKMMLLQVRVLFKR